MTTPASGGGGPSALRVGGLALIGVAVVAAIIGLAGLAANGDPSPTAAPQPAPSSTPAPEPVPPPAPPPTTAPVPTGDAGVPVPPPGEAPPGEAPPGEPRPGEPAPGEQAPPAAAPAPAPGGTPEAPGAPGDPGPPPQNPAPPDGDGGPAPQAAPAPGGNGNGGNGGRARAGDTAGDAGTGGTSAVRMPLRVYNNSTITGLATRAADDFRNAGWPIDVIGNYSQGVIPTSTVYYRPGTDEEAAAHALGEQFGMRANPRFEGLKDASPGLIVIVTNDYDGR